MTDDFRAQLHQAWTEEHRRTPTWVEEILIDTYAEHMDVAMGRIFGDAVDWKPIGILGVDVAPWLADELDFLGVSPIRAALARARPHGTPPAALRGPSVPPNGTPAEERALANRIRSARDLIRQADAPILAAAAAQLLGGSNGWGGFDAWESTNAAGPATEEQRIARELVPLVRAAAAEEQAEILRGEASIAACLAPEPTPRPHSRTFPCWCGGFATAFGNVHLDERVPRGTPGYMFDPDDYEGWFQP